MSTSKSVERLLREFSVEKNFYDDRTESERVLKKMTRSLGKGGIVDSEELWGDEASEYAIFYQYSKEIRPQELAEKIMEHVPEQDEYQMYYVVIFTDTFIRKTEAGQWEKEIRNHIKRQLKCGLSKISYQILNYWNNEKKTYFIAIGDRLNRIRMPEKDNIQQGVQEDAIARKVKAYTYTASLYDIVKMYNEVGDELFRQNVRYGIKDQLDVEENIKETLREYPEDFWYLNNGITIIVQDHKALNLERSESIGLDYKKSQIISVINGAQTISAAARFWFENTGNMDGEQDDTELRRWAEVSAKVLLRIMCVSHSEDECQKELDKISISLNRQKPIKSEDIAYTSPVILEINQLYHPDINDDIHFRITKRGEEIIGKYKYNLTDFARAVKAYRMQKPGEARTQTANKILAYTPNDPNSIYADEILENDAEIVFSKYYRPTNFAMRLLGYYKEYGSRSEKNEHKSAAAILGNGRYYFAAYVIHVLHDDTSDFTDFNYPIEKINQEFDKKVEKYVKILGEIGDEYLEESEEEIIESNTFKGERLYQRLIRYEEEGRNEDTRESVSHLKREIREWFED